MTPRVIKILLAVSVALNLFAVAAGAAAWFTRTKVEAQVEAQNRPVRGGPAMSVVAELAPASQDRVRQALRASALAARPDFEAARAARREAIRQAGVEPLDRAAIQSLLEQSRLAEMRGRARLESDALEILAGLAPAERVILAPILSRQGRSRDGGCRGDNCPNKDEARPHPQPMRSSPPG